MKTVSSRRTALHLHLIYRVAVDPWSMYLVQVPRRLREARRSDGIPNHVEFEPDPGVGSGGGLASAAALGRASRTLGPDQQAVTTRPAPSVRPRHLPRADLLKRVFGAEALRCECGHSLRVIAAITEPNVAMRILECMGIPPRAPPVERASTSVIVEDPSLDQAEAASFDQSPPDDWDLGA